MTDTREIKISDIDKIVARLAEMPYRHVHDIVLFLAQLKSKPEAVAPDNGEVPIKHKSRLPEDAEAKE